jgi:branched-chain amino acid transport system permease protein
MDLLGIATNALVLGAFISTLTVALSMRYRVTKVIDLSLGAFSDISYIAMTVMYSIRGNIVWGLSPYCQLPPLFLLGGVLGLVSWVVIKVLSRMTSSRVIPTLGTIGLLVIFTELSKTELWELILGYWPLSSGHARATDFVLYDVRGAFYVSIALSAIVFALLLVTPRLLKTSRGEPQGLLRRLVSGGTWKRDVLIFFLSGGLAGVSGGIFQTWMIFPLGIGVAASIAAAGLLAGFESPSLGFVSGYVIGAAEFLLLQYMLTWTFQILEYQWLIPVAIVILTLLILPGRRKYLRPFFKIAK